jgi:hypothetical protein
MVLKIANGRDLSRMNVTESSRKNNIRPIEGTDALLAVGIML